MENSAISQGFTFRQPKKPGTNCTDASKYYKGFAPPVSTAEIRWKICQKQIIELKRITQNLISGWNDEVARRLVAYLNCTATSVRDFQGAITPMAIVISGVSGEENKILMQTLLAKVKEFSPHVAFISSKMRLNAKASFQYLCAQIMGDDVYRNDGVILKPEEDVVVDESLNEETSTRKLLHADASDLKAWYDRFPRPPVVIFIEDMDVLPVKIVQSVIVGFSCIKLPVIFVSVVTSCSEEFDSFVPHKCPTTFVYKTFEPISPEKRLGDFMNEILKIRVTPFQLGGEVIDYLSNLFLSEEQSISRLEQYIKLCLIEHYRLAESVLCAELGFLQNSVLKTDVLSASVIKATFTEETVKLVPRMRISLKDNWTVTSCNRSPAKSLRQVPTDLKELEYQVVDFQKKQSEWRIYLEFLFAVTKNLPGIPEEFKSLHSCYVMCYKGKLFEDISGKDSNFTESLLDKAMAIVRILACSELENRLSQGLQVLKLNVEELRHINVSQTNFPCLVDKVEQFLKKLAKAAEGDKDEKQHEAFETEKKPNRVYKSHLEFMQAMKSKAQESGRHYVKLRESIINELCNDAKTFLKLIGNHPYAKVFIFDDVEFLRESITASSHKQIHAALSEQKVFLKCSHYGDDFKNCHSKSDIAIVYGLIMEQQMKNINLNILFESFRSEVEQNPFSCTPNSKKGKQPPSSAVLQGFLIRFRQATAELQHMGFIKICKSRIHPDEVARLQF